MDALGEQALEAAALLIQEGAADRLSAETIAAASGLSVAEITARWPTTEDLVAAVAVKAYATFRREIDNAVGTDEAPGAFLRGYLEASFPTDPERDNFIALVTTLFMSAPLRHDTFAPVRAAQRDIDTALTADGLDPVMARILRFAIDGLYLSDVFSVTALSPQERVEVLSRLAALSRPDRASAPATGLPLSANDA